MAATAGSIYQAIRTKHVSNVPPNAFPQTSFETFSQYQVRMASQGLPPDINPTESDADYLVRLASYSAPPLGQFQYSSSLHNLVLTSPNTGSHYLSVATNQFFIYNGLTWKSASLS